MEILPIQELETLIIGIVYVIVETLIAGGAESANV
jgi:hypothetical protein